MVIGRRRQAEQFLQQPMHAGRVEQIRPPHDVGYALQARRRPRRTDGSSSARPGAPARHRPRRPGLATMISDRSILASISFHDSSPARASAAFISRRRTWSAPAAILRARSACDKSAQNLGRAAHRRDRAARGRGVRVRDQRCNLGSAFEARIDETKPLKTGQRRPIIGKMLALAADRLLPGDPEPGKIVVRSPARIRAGTAPYRCPRSATTAFRPVEFAMSKLVSADSAWPRWR